MRRMMMLGALGAAMGLAGCVAPPAGGVVFLQPPPILAPTCDTSFRVVNASNRVVERLYFSHSSLNGWGPDQLGQGVLPPGRSMSYRASNTGNYDFRVVWVGGRETELRQINVCSASQITVTNRGLSAS